MKTKSYLLDDRLQLIVRLRESENKLFREIAHTIGVCTARARELYRRAKRRQADEIRYKHGFPRELSVRSENCCFNANLRTRSQISRAIKSGRLHPNNSGRWIDDKHTSFLRNYGWKSHNEILTWLGMNP